MLNLIGRAYAQYTGFNLHFVPQGTGLNQVMTWILNAVLIMAGAIAVIYLVYGGILYITAGGDAEKATKGRTAVINAIIGIIIILLALVIVRWVGALIGGGNPS